MNTAIVGAVGYQTAKARHNRVNDPPSERNGDLKLGIGSFLVCDSGITAELKSPLSMLSRHIPWKQVPPYIAGLWLVYADPMDPSEDSWSQRATRLLSNEQRSVLSSIRTSKAIGPEAAELKHWAGKLSSRCPYASTAYDLRGIASWTPRQLDSFAASNFPV